MICRRCALRLRSSLRPDRIIGRQRQPELASFLGPLQQRHPLNTLANPRPSPGADHEGPPAATSTSAAQPFTTPLTPAPAGKEPATLSEPRSSVPAGTPLEGLNYLKNNSSPLALEDHEYPEWLWTLLDSQMTAGEGTIGAEGDAYAKSKKQRRIAARAARRAEKERSEELFPPVPIEAQTIDLPAGDGTEAGARNAEAARAELNLAMRKTRRKGIKERNYLGGMP